MTDLERRIHGALVQLEEAAARRAGAGPGGILGLLEDLDRLAAELPADAPGDLRHYLQRKSYQKARQFLEGRSGEVTPGACGR